MGHTDFTGGPEYNIGLSDKRAEAVRLALVDHGVDAGRLRSEGRGETQSKAENDTLGRARHQPSCGISPARSQPLSGQGRSMRSELGRFNSGISMHGNARTMITRNRAH